MQNFVKSAEQNLLLSLLSQLALGSSSSFFCWSVLMSHNQWEKIFASNALPLWNLLYTFEHNEMAFDCSLTPVVASGLEFEFFALEHFFGVQRSAENRRKTAQMFGLEHLSSFCVCYQSEEHFACRERHVVWLILSLTLNWTTQSTRL